MLPKWHILIALIFSLILLFIFDISSFNILIFILASFLIDVDHYFNYIWRKKDLSLKKAYNFFLRKKQKWKKLSYKKKNKLKIDILIFHGIEFLFVLAVLSFFYPIFFFVFLGVLIHLSMDYYEIIFEKHPLYIKLSQIYLLISNRNKKELKI